MLGMCFTKLLRNGYRYDIDYKLGVVYHLFKANEAAKATAPATADILGDFPIIQAKPPAATVATEDANIFDVNDLF